MKSNFSILVLTLFAFKIMSIYGHGYLFDPIARSSAWRNYSGFEGYYTDNQMFCGGADTLWNSNGGKCGICGEDYNAPKLFEKGGPLYRGIIFRQYTCGQVIMVKVVITANHLGYFEFRVCNVDGFSGDATQACLDLHVLTDTYGNSKFKIGSDTGLYTLPVVLPRGFTCNHCVFQWKYNAGNSWGTDSNGFSCLGCGKQEQFYGCSDISIIKPQQDEKPKVLDKIKRLNRL